MDLRQILYVQSFQTILTPSRLVFFCPFITQKVQFDNYKCNVRECAT